MTEQCPNCEGDAMLFGVYGQLDTMYPCPRCKGRGTVLVKGCDARSCRFCGEATVGLFEFPKGCACFPNDRVQALCLQHAAETEDIDGMEQIAEWVKPAPFPLKVSEGVRWRDIPVTPEEDEAADQLARGGTFVRTPLISEHVRCQFASRLPPVLDIE